MGNERDRGHSIRTSMRIGIAKGRGFTECAELIESAGFSLPPEFLRSRLTITQVPAGTIVAVRSSDLPWLLENGHIDVAVGSSIWFDEYGSAAMIEGEALDVGQCRLSLIAKGDGELRRICTRFTSLTRRLVSGRHAGAAIVQMTGSHEIAIELGIADAIVDVIETGWTLRRFHLTELQVLRPVHHGMWIRAHDSAAQQLVQQMAASRSVAAGPPRCPRS
jgi:ATP phosphoribosyltransferase